MAAPHDDPAAPDQHPGAVAMHDDHGHGDDHHEAHGPADDAWVLLPLVVGAVIGIVLAVIFALQSAAPALT
ncbi:MAG: hypothetical protein ACR2MB_17310 [Acidimicrobiales bacterium]